MLDRFKTLVSYGLYLLSVATLALLIGGSERTLASDTELGTATPSNLMRVTVSESDTDIGIAFRIPSTVSLAKDLEVGGYTGFYEVEVMSLGEGDCLIIEPDEELELRQEGKEPIKAIVDQRETEFSEAKTVEGQIRVYEGERLSAGIWAGSFSFNITTVKNKNGVQHSVDKDNDSTNDETFDNINMSESDVSEEIISSSESGVIVEVADEENIESLEELEIGTAEIESSEIESTETESTKEVEFIEIESTEDIEVDSSEVESAEPESIEEVESAEELETETTESTESIETESVEIEGLGEIKSDDGVLKENEIWES